MGKREYRTHNDPSQSNFGDHYPVSGQEYPYGAKARGSGAVLEPQPRSVDSMKAPEQVHVEFKNGRYWARVDGYGSQYLGYGDTVREAREDALEAVAEIKRSKGSHVQNAEYFANKPGAPPEWKPPAVTKGSMSYYAPGKGDLAHYFEGSVDNIEVPKTRGIPTGSVRVQKVEVRRAEGPTADPNLNKWLTFDSLEEADRFITENGRGMPEEQLGYDKHDFKVHFTDGSVYTGRYDEQRRERADIGKQMHEFSGYMAKTKKAEGFTWVTPKDRWMARYMHKITDAKHLKPIPQLAEPESLAALEKKHHEYWEGMRKATEGLSGEKEFQARKEYAMTYGKKRDLGPYIYRTSIGHYGGMFIEVPEEKFEDFKSHWPRKEFPRNVESKDMNDPNRYDSEAIVHYHQVFPGLSGKIREVFFADRSKGMQRLDFYDLPHERETNPGD
jgi:hypothetical protein